MAWLLRSRDVPCSPRLSLHHRAVAPFVLALVAASAWLVACGGDGDSPARTGADLLPDPGRQPLLASVHGLATELRHDGEAGSGIIDAEGLVVAAPGVSR
jgi:hypothetical protein